MVYGYNYPIAYLKPQVEEVLKPFGPMLSGDHQKMKKKAIQLLDESEDFITAVGGIRMLEAFNARDEILSLEGEQFAVGDKVANTLSSASGAALVLATVGEDVSTWADAHMLDEPLSTYIIRSIAAQSLVNTIQLLINEVVPLVEMENIQMSPFFQPGYCGWVVEDQERLLQFFPPNYSGISVGKSFQLNPPYSSIGVAGLGKKAPRRIDICETCPAGLCLSRVSY